MGVNKVDVVAPVTMVFNQSPQDFRDLEGRREDDAAL